MILNLDYLFKSFPPCPSCGKYPVIFNNDLFCEILCTKCRSKVKELDAFSAIEKWKDFINTKEEKNFVKALQRKHDCCVLGTHEKNA